MRSARSKNGYTEPSSQWCCGKASGHLRVKRPIDDRPRGSGPAPGRRRGTAGSVPAPPGREPQRTHARAHASPLTPKDTRGVRTLRHAKDTHGACAHPLTPKDTHGACAYSAHAQGHTRRCAHSAHAKDTRARAHTRHAHAQRFPRQGGTARRWR